MRAKEHNTIVAQKRKQRLEKEHIMLKAKDNSRWDDFRERKKAIVNKYLALKATSVSA